MNIDDSHSQSKQDDTTSHKSNNQTECTMPNDKKVCISA